MHCRVLRVYYCITLSCIVFITDTVRTPISIRTFQELQYLVMVRRKQT